MNERQTEAPAYKQSEAKVIASAAQLLAANPQQKQYYTIQNDITRSIYASGDWFNAHPECMLKDANGSLVNSTHANQKIPECTQGPNKDTCHWYGFQTQCGRDAWVKFAVDTVTQGNLDGVFIDGFQGCSPEGGCGMATKTCTAAQAKAWLSGLEAALWDLHDQLKAKGNKTIICNDTGQMFACGGKKPCYCDAANKERFYPNVNDLKQVVAAANDDNGLGHPFWGIIHVPHINEQRTNFNKSLAGFLATAGGAGTPFGFGVGFGYDCEEGGWLKEYPELDKPLGRPAGPAKVAQQPDGSTIFTRKYTGGVSAFYNATVHPHNSASCVMWADGTHTDGHGGCAQAAAWDQ